MVLYSTIVISVARSSMFRCFYLETAWLFTLAKRQKHEQKGIENTRVTETEIKSLKRH